MVLNIRLTAEEGYAALVSADPLVAIRSCFPDIQSEERALQALLSSHEDAPPTYGWPKVERPGREGDANDYGWFCDYLRNALASLTTLLETEPNYGSPTYDAMVSQVLSQTTKRLVEGKGEFDLLRDRILEAYKHGDADEKVDKAKTMQAFKVLAGLELHIDELTMKIGTYLGHQKVVAGRG